MGIYIFPSEHTAYVLVPSGPIAAVLSASTAPGPSGPVFPRARFNTSEHQNVL